MTRTTLRQLLCGTATLAALCSPAMAAEIASVAFSHSPAPATDAEMIAPHTTSVATVTYADGTTKDFPLSYKVIFKNTDQFNGRATGQLYTVDGDALADLNGDMVVAETPDANSLLMVDGKPHLITHFEYDWILGNGEEGRKAEGWYSRMPASMTHATLAQADDGTLTATDVRPVDFSGVDGLWIPCAGGPSPWGTHIGSEEDYDLYFQVISGEKQHKTATEGLKALTQAYFKGKREANPYDYGYIPEVTVNADGTTSVVKHYSMGRATWELARVMDDQRTAYYGDDGTNVALFMYVADKEADLTAGSLYAAKWTQTSEANGGAADITWVKLGHATDAEVRAIIDTGITFDDIFESTTSEATPDWEAKGFKRIRAGHSGDEFLKLKEGKEQAAAFLESRRYAALLGATTEFNKMEGVAADGVGKKLWVAMSYIDKGMKADETGPVDDIKVAKIAAGGTYELPMEGGQKDTAGEPINSDYVGVKMAIPAALLGEDIEADKLGNTANPEKIANPDNLSWSPKMKTLFVGEDSGTHVNNAIWAYSPETGALSRILSQPSGAEATGLLAVDNAGGHAYIMANNQHQGEWLDSMPEDVKARLTEAAKAAYGTNAKGVPNYYLEANVGYLAGLPGL